MLQNIDFSFASSLIALNPPFLPDDHDAIMHLLPPQPYHSKSSGLKKNQNQSIVSNPNSKGDYVDFTLGNSPEYPNLVEPRKQLFGISTFNQKLANKSNKQVIKPIEAPNDVKKPIVNNKHQNKTKELVVPKRNEQQFMPLKQSHQKSMEQSRTQRESPGRSFRVHNCSNDGISLQNQRTVRNPREETIYIAQKPKNKPNSKTPIVAKNISPDKLALVNKIQQLKTRIMECENLNKNLAMQLQTFRQKLKIKQSQNNSIKEQLIAVAGYHESSEARCKQLERDLVELKKMNEYFCDEIDKQKEEVTRYEYKNEQSLRLLQKLNENITKRQQKLQRQLSQQSVSLSKIQSEKNENQSKLHVCLQQIENLRQRYNKSEERCKQLSESIALMAKNLEKYQSDIKQRQLENKQRQLRQKQLQIELKLSKQENSNLKSASIEMNEQKQKILIELGKYQQQTSQLKQRNQQQSQRINNLQNGRQNEIGQIHRSYEDGINELKKKIEQYENQIQNLYYENKQYQMKLEISNENVNQNLQQLKELKEQKRILYLQKQQLKRDIKQLLDKNDQLFANLEASKKRQIHLNQTIQTCQKQIIVLEQRISQNIADIANKDIQNANLVEQIRQQKNINAEHIKNIDSKVLKISDLQQRLKKYEKMLAIYKEEISKMKQKKEQQWQEMKGIYEQQISILQQKLKQFAEIRDGKKGKTTHKKIVKSEIIEQSIQIGSKIQGRSFSIEQVQQKQVQQI